MIAIGSGMVKYDPQTLTVELSIKGVNVVLSFQEAARLLDHLNEAVGDLDKVRHD